MKKLVLLTIAFIMFCSHDMFLKMDSFFLKPDRPVTLHLYNGTFEKSENVITRDRMQDVSIVGNGTRQQAVDSMWAEKGNVTVLNFQSGLPGTWVAGVSIRPNNIELSAADFNEYLEHDGVLDELERREKNETLEHSAIEKYSKHVKAIFQVGDQKTDDWKTPLGYPIEFIPENNPYDLGKGEKLQVLLLRNGQPLPDQLVYYGFAGDGHSHQHEDPEDEANQEAHQHDGLKMKTDATGRVQLNIDHDGHWYLRTIHMVESEEPGLTHESNWATLTFEVSGHGHSHLMIPSWAYCAGGLLILFGVFFYFKK